MVAILNDNGTAVVTYTYDAWGDILTIGGTMADTLGVHNPLRYRGYVYDEETSLYYLQSRYYDPNMGRFLNADAFASTGQGFGGNNMFAYCCNNPVAFLDDCGHSIRPSTKIINDGANGDAITEGLGIAHALGYFSDVSYSKITVDLEKCMESIGYLHTVVNLPMNIIFSEMGEGACDRYNDLYGEPFLLSGSCVGNEIDIHFKGYLWGRGSAFWPGFAVWGYSMKNSVPRKDMEYVMQMADIRLNDVKAGGGMFSQAVIFDYKNGIRGCYIGSERDPWAGYR